MAIIGKEWRRLLRSKGMPWALAAYLILPALVTGAYMQTMGARAQAMQGMGQLIPQMGAQALSTVATWQIILLAVAAPWFSAPLLAGEVEESTLDPLLASGQRLIGVVAAKYLAVLLFLTLFVVAGLPVFALPYLIGGVNTLLVGRAVALELATVLFMSGVGLLLSAFGRRVGSVAMTGVTVGLMLVIGSGFANSTLAGGTYNQDQMIMMMKMGIAQPMQPQTMAPWLYANPLVGLNSALNQAGMQGGTALPGADSRPVYKEYRLWQVQIAGAGAAALLSLLTAWIGMVVRLRWRWPRWAGFRRRKGVALNG